jgi:leucine dehydrogenase
VFEDLIAGWGGERVVVRYDAPSRAWMFVCMHSTRLGPAGGGTRMKVYPSPADGLADAMRLSTAMTSKFAVVGLPFGGGKAVLAVPALPEGVERRELLLRYGETVASLRGGFITAPDVNTSEADMDVVAERAPGLAFCRPQASGGSGSSARPTAIGVFEGMRATAKRVLGSDVGGLTVLVQGAGGVGANLVELLGTAGASVVVSDVDETRAREAAASVGGTVVPADRATEADCDVYAPCALGGTLDEPTIRGLRCRIVAGAANNQLAMPEDADRLAARGIVYAPDFVINAGGALHGAGLELLGWDGETLARRLAGIGDTLLEVYDRAERDGTSTAAAAERFAQERLAAAPVS